MFRKISKEKKIGSIPIKSKFQTIANNIKEIRMILQ